MLVVLEFHGDDLYDGPVPRASPADGTLGLRGVQSREVRRGLRAVHPLYGYHQHRSATHFWLVVFYFLDVGPRFDL